MKIQIATANLRKTDIISIRSASRVGKLTACEVDTETGIILGIYADRAKKLCIPWSKVVRIGCDCILADVEGTGETEPCVRF